MSRKKQILDLEYMHKLAETIKASDSENQVLSGLEYALRFYDIINFNFNYERSFIRARHTNNGTPWGSTSDLYYPPPNAVSAGRLNEAGSPCLYLSLTLDTALAEIKAKENDIVQVSMFAVKQGLNLRVGVVGEKFRVARGAGHFLQGDNALAITKLIRKLDSESRVKTMAFLYPDLFFDEILTDVNAASTKYLHSRMLAKLILEKQPSLDGILYHSVAHMGAKNIAVPARRADEILGFVDTLLVKVNKVYPYGMYDVEFVKSPKNILRSGEILWE